MPQEEQLGRRSLAKTPPREQRRSLAETPPPSEQGGVFARLRLEWSGGVSEKVESQSTNQNMAREKTKARLDQTTKAGHNRTGWMGDERTKTDKN